MSAGEEVGAEALAADAPGDALAVLPVAVAFCVAFAVWFA